MIVSDRKERVEHEEQADEEEAERDERAEILIDSSASKSREATSLCSNKSHWSSSNCRPCNTASMEERNEFPIFFHLIPCVSSKKRGSQRLLSLPYDVRPKANVQRLQRH
eukprot:768582-Hanusia_phi.AAC.7